MSDPTEPIRRALVPQMPEMAQEAIDRGEQVWSTEELRTDFEVLAFAAPMVIVKRRSDGVRGAMFFSHRPRWYWGFVGDE